MNDPLVLPLSDPRANLEAVGGKGASLAKLSRAGLPVPGGFHITTEAYRLFVTANQIQPRILDALQGADPVDLALLQTVSAQIGGFFAAGKMPDEIERAVSDAYAVMKDIPVAVRSSATAEDLADASFAGQQDTFLNISGRKAVLDAVKRCWASLWTARAMAYRARQGIGPEDVALAVVVQELVFADAAGVLFTANPVNGKRDELMMTASWGLGEAIVSGAVTPDTLIVHKGEHTVSPIRLVRREIGDKQVMTVRSTGGGTWMKPVPRRLQRAAVLSTGQIKELAGLGAKIESLYREPMDVEWTLAGGKFAIVQARPITALPEPPLEWPIPFPKAILARGSFAEFFPEPVSPLFATLAMPLAVEASVKMMSEFMKIDARGSYLLTVVNGYVYMGMLFTPAFIWATIKGSITVSTRLLKSAKVREQVARRNFQETVQRWQALDLAAAAPTQLLAGVNALFLATAEYYTVVQASSIPLATFSEIIFSKYYDSLVKRKGDLEAPAFLFGGENQAMRAEKSLFDLAMWLKDQPDLTELLSRPADAICRALAAPATPPAAGAEPGGGEAWDEFSTRFAAHLAQFGHAIYDLDFAKPVPADAPAPLVEMLKVYLAGEINPYERQRSALEFRRQGEETIVRRLDPLRRKWFLKLLKWAQGAAPLREDSIADLGLGYPLLRRMLAELGRRFVSGGVMAKAEDVYWLEAHEVECEVNALESGGMLSNLAEPVTARQARWQAMRQVTPPSSLPRMTWMARFVPDVDQKGIILKGYGASAGVVQARACVLTGPADFDQMRAGDVIVAGITTPAWTPLFVRASAIVTDIGGPLSHSSIVAREYGIPAVLGTGSATRRIKTGQIITVDGRAGKVILKEG